MYIKYIYYKIKEKFGSICNFGLYYDGFGIFKVLLW